MGAHVQVAGSHACRARLPRVGSIEYVTPKTDPTRIAHAGAIRVRNRRSQECYFSLITETITTPRPSSPAAKRLMPNDEISDME
jgi:hypothetical protein